MNLIPRPVGDKLTLLENQQAVDQRQQRQAVRRYDDGHVAVRQNLQAFEKFCFAPRIEMRRRFVQKENLWLANERPREPDRLLLPSGQAPAAFRNRHVVAKRVASQRTVRRPQDERLRESARLSPEGSPRAILSRSLPKNRSVSCRTKPIPRRRSAGSYWRSSAPSIRMLPSSGS